ncbi:Polysaccharide pyruvyl transferase family protein WcaK [Arboricoccus pini]|uniref:Polysaccharide pyruvyl transferase family protein WcaK n=1 Tax=Arboricoccus pini TaxID=1963835 RepID=A0A212RR55_9PROT|nr:polysaccharide pyruvyl transferase family protein [Arboricoccus pini]SNB75088.1 Polysaccharide pyruvyl transferase family protein WcaK [Arboricoccus pini]
MQIITLFDTSVATDNLGDQIIIDAVNEELHETLPDAYVFTVASHDYLSHVSRRLLKKSAFAIVGGTNIMSSRMHRHALWKLVPWDVGSVHDVILMGVGWRNYMDPPDAYTRWLYRKVLSRQGIHSARDGYTQKRIGEIVPNVVNTACPTMWKLSPERCAAIPRKKADTVLFTLTYYRANLEADRAFVELLRANYNQLIFWPQQSDDMAYMEGIGLRGIKVADPNVAYYTQTLKNEDLDFVGSRLHGGIRALQCGKRSLIMAVDNRAAEIGKDTNLPVVDRADLPAIERWIHGDDATEIHLPLDAIKQWRGQFRN